MTAVATTIKDVARCAGVSVATVSRALNGGENVEPSTRQRVLDVVRELRYLPSGAARSLITRKTDTIGVLLPHLYGEYFSELVRGIDQAARAHGLHLLLSSSHGSSSEAASALRSMAGRVDGVIVMWPHAVQELLARNLRLRMPVVLLNVGKPPALTTMSVPVASLGTQAVNKLADALNQDSPSSRPLSTRVPSQLVVRRSCGAA